MQKQLFKTIVRSAALHARLLNTLSLMELSGAQRIARLIAPAACSSFLLEHAAEEFRHAYYLRKLANKVALAPIESYAQENTLAWPKSALYLKHLDRRICLALRSQGLCTPNLIKRRAYILTTLAIEMRALPFYRCYQEVLDEEGIGLNIKSILSEEEDHLIHIKNMAASDPHLEPLIPLGQACEEELFSTWMQSLDEALRRASQNGIAALTNKPTLEI